jgi:hypothetical protein
VPDSFGSFSVPSPQLARGRASSCVPRDETAFLGGDDSRSVTMAARDFDPMLLEAEVNGSLTRACNLDAATTLVSLQCLAGILLREDPMLMELDLHSAPTTPTTCDEDFWSSPVDLQPDAAPSSPDGCFPPDRVALETVCFDVPAAEPVCCDSSLRNITVARGIRETLPLHLFSDVGSPAMEAVVNFAIAICREAPEPV